METTNVATVDSTMSTEINDIAIALSNAQSELESVGKSEQGFNYNYASLPATIQVAKPILCKNGLAVTQLLGNATNGDPSVTTILMHTSGQFIKSVTSGPLIEMKGCNNMQIAGAVYSYLRRYALQGILNMSSADNDASSNGTTKPATKTNFTKKAASPQKFRKKADTTTEVEHDI